MPLFRRNHHPSPEARSTSNPGPARTTGHPAPDELEWRSYDSAAEVYARVHAPRMALPAKDLVAMVQVQPGHRVLDVGTGTGVAARAASEAAPDALVVGIDPSVPMLQLAAHGGGPRYAAAVALDLPFRDQTFDRLVANFVLSHFLKPDTALFDLMRVLKPGGRMAVSAWSDDEDEFSKAWAGVAEEFAEHEMLADARERAMPNADRFARKDDLKNALHDAGLRDIQMELKAYHFQMTAEDYLEGREILSTGRFLHAMLGEELWEMFRRRTREVFAERFPPTFNDYREVLLAVGHKPQG
jgi:ubiquinone/menaquinone biosynthesis C-methylase UbiE